MAMHYYVVLAAVKSGGFGRGLRRPVFVRFPLRVRCQPVGTLRTPSVQPGGGPAAELSFGKCTRFHRSGAAHLGPPADEFRYRLFFNWAMAIARGSARGPRLQKKPIRGAKAGDDSLES